MLKAACAYSRPAQNSWRRKRQISSPQSFHPVYPELDRLPVWCAGCAVEAGPVIDWLIEYSSSPCVWACTHAAW